MLENKERKYMEDEEEEMTVEEYERLHPEVMDDDWNMGLSEFSLAALDKHSREEFPDLAALEDRMDAMEAEREKNRKIMNKVHSRSGKADVITFPGKK